MHKTSVRMLSNINTYDFNNFNHYFLIYKKQISHYCQENITIFSLKETFESMLIKDFKKVKKSKVSNAYYFF